MPFNVPSVTKPFADYKWRWMEFTPVESFNRPDILLGITRAILECEGISASNSLFLDRLTAIQSDLLSDSEIRLVPSDPQRNVLRRQGRYWRGLGLLGRESTRSLQLTEFGKQYANGTLSNDDFITSIVNTHGLPNKLIENDETIDKWSNAGISIKPLRLILELLSYLTDEYDTLSAFITPNELGKVIIPLVLHSTNVTFLAEALIEYRNNPGIFESLPDCTQKANDQRMVREHLLILYYFGLLQRDNTLGNNRAEKYFLASVDVSVIRDLLASETVEATPVVDIFNQVPIYFAPPNIRTRKLVEITSRPNQAGFRKALLANFNGRCAITDELVSDVLIACHIHEVKDGGSDHSSNGLILRADLHILFDKNKLRISPDGDVIFSPDISELSAYLSLPKKISIPKSVDRELLRRRFEYGTVILPQHDTNN